MGINFHPNEKFGHPASTSIRPHSSHACWNRGWVLCDCLPLSVQVRFDDCKEDYSGLGRPGVFLVEPVSDMWEFPFNRSITVNHPLGPMPVRGNKQSRKKKGLDVTRVQVPLGPEQQVTYQNIQGQTVKGPCGEPKGFVLDMYRPASMRGELRA